VARAGKGAFEATGPAEVIGLVSCGGCPGKRAVGRAKVLIDRGADGIAFASCMGRGNPIGFACPHFATIKDAVQKKIGPDKQVIDWTH
jgi:predicted metal-binding protein